jgi:hypothetical protein
MGILDFPSINKNIILCLLKKTPAYGVQQMKSQTKGESITAPLTSCLTGLE